MNDPIVERCEGCPNCIMSEEKAKKFMDNYPDYAKEIEKLRSQNARYREALKQYIDLNYYPDCGDVAREALKEADDGK